MILLALHYVCEHANSSTFATDTNHCQLNFRFVLSPLSVLTFHIFLLRVRP